MNNIFYAQIHKEGGDSGYRVDIPGFSGELSPEKPLFSTTKEEGIIAAKNSLETFFLRCISNGNPIPAQQLDDSSDLALILISEQMGFALWLREQRAKKNLSQSQTAKLLNVSTRHYQKMEAPKQCNPTLKTIYKVLAALNIESIEMKHPIKK